MSKPLYFLYLELKAIFKVLKESLSKRLIYFLGFSLFLFISSLGFSFLGYFGQRIDQVKAVRLELENKVLAGKLLDLEFLQMQLDKEIKILGLMEQNLRNLFGLKSEKLKDLPVGGQLPSESSYPYLEVQGTGLDELIKEIRSEKEGFELIYERLVQKKELLDHTPSVYPVDGYISRGFGIFPDPFTGEYELHQGLDIVADLGTSVIAPAEGKVIFIGWQKGLGKLVTIDHGKGCQSSYGHLSVILVKSKEEVKRGEIIGRVGNTGYSTGPHLHYEIHLKGRPVNPQSYLWGGKY